MNRDFERITPEEAGIPSSEILAYLKELTGARLCLHDLIIFRNGRLLYEGYWSPMSRDFLHRHYSCTKSFVSVAVGAAIGDGLLSLDDRAADFFPDKVPENMHPWLAEVTIRDMLRMSTCFTQGAYYSPSAPDWADTWFGAKPSHKPGRVFSYDTAATTMLCIILRRVTGMEFHDYLRTKVYDKIGFDPERESFCVETPCGHQWGGSGLVCRPYDFARFALFCMNGGAWNGEQLVPEWYMREATTRQIDIQQDAADGRNIGYGYQFWILPDGGFSFNGMGCQFALCKPEEGLLLITHGYEGLSPSAGTLIFDGFSRHILPHPDRAIPVDTEASAALREFTEKLSMAVPAGETDNPAAAGLSGRSYVFEENELGWRRASFGFSADGGVIRYENATGEHTLAFGLGRQVSQDFPEIHYFDRRIGEPCGHGYLCHTSAAWSERTTDGGQSDALSLWCQICGSHLGQLRATFAFADGSVTIRMCNHAEWFLQEYSGFATGVLEK